MTFIAKLTGHKATLISTMALAGVLLIGLPATAVQAQWTTNGNDISNSNSGNVGIGTSAPVSRLHVATEATGTRGITSAQHSADGNGAMVNLRKTRGTTASPSAAVNGDSIGNLYAEGYDGSSYISGGRIRFVIDDTVSTGVVPTSVQFFSGTGNFGGVERMRITSAGNVGIGTTSPGYKLDLQGGQFNASGGLCIAGDCKTAWSQVSGSSQWSTSGSNIYYNAGNVGIGTSNPVAKFVVTGGADTSLAIGDRTTSGSVGLQFLGTGYKHAGLRFDGDNLILENASVSSTPSTWYSANPMNFIVRYGSVGIGTTSPAYKLDVQGGPLNSSGGLCIAGDCKTAWSQVAGSQWTTQSSNIYYNTGNIGIGTTSPIYKLHVVSGTDTGTALLNLDTGVHGGTVMAVYGTGNNESGFDMSVYRAGAYLSRLGVNSAGSVYLQSGTGTVGIGMTTPNTSYKLDVNGNTNITGNINVTGNIAAKYQDVAEWVHSSQELTAGTVVVLDPTKSNQVIASAQAYDTRVAGVISPQPGITLGESGAGKVLVATTGRVRIKVDASRGAIQVGDLLVTSDVPGVAMKSQPINVGGVQIHRPGTLLGKALEPLAEGTSEILVLLSLQ